MATDIKPEESNRYWIATVIEIVLPNFLNCFRTTYQVPDSFQFLTPRGHRRTDGAIVVTIPVLAPTEITDLGSTVELIYLSNAKGTVLTLSESEGMVHLGNVFDVEVFQVLKGVPVGKV